MKQQQDRRLTIRVTAQEYATIEEIRKNMQERAGNHVRVTQRTVLMDALELLFMREADRKRKR